MRWKTAVALVMAAAWAMPAQAVMPGVTPDTKPCKLDDVTGAWRLARYFEQPEGPAFAQFRANPVSYAYFDKNQTFAELPAKALINDASALQTSLRAQYKTAMQQFVLTPQGVIYLYAQGKATGPGFYCQIVTAPKGGFNTGNMLFRTSDQGRLVLRQYIRPTFAPAQGASKK